MISGVFSCRNQSQNAKLQILKFQKVLVLAQLFYRYLSMVTLSSQALTDSPVVFLMQFPEAKNLKPNQVELWYFREQGR